MKTHPNMHAYASYMYTGKTVKHTGWSQQYLALLKALTVFQTISSKKQWANFYISSLTETKYIWSLF